PRPRRYRDASGRAVLDGRLHRRPGRAVGGAGPRPDPHRRLLHGRPARAPRRGAEAGAGGVAPHQRRARVPGRGRARRTRPRRRGARGAHREGRDRALRRLLAVASPLRRAGPAGGRPRRRGAGRAPQEPRRRTRLLASRHGGRRHGAGVGRPAARHGAVHLRRGSARPRLRRVGATARGPRATRPGRDRAPGRPRRPPGAARRLRQDPRQSPRGGDHRWRLLFQLHRRVKTGRVTRGPKSLAVEHAAVVDAREDEPSLALRGEPLHLARHVIGFPRGDRHSSTPRVSSSAYASSAPAMRFSAPTSAGGELEANAVRTGRAAIEIAKWTSITVMGASRATKRTIGTANAAHTRIKSRTRVCSRPMRVASVRLPAAASVSMSRRVLRTRCAVARKPIPHPTRTLSTSTWPVSTYEVPTVATMPRTSEKRT